MDIVAVAEKTAEYAPSGAGNYVPKGKVVAIHAAAADLFVPEDPSDATLCGKSSAAMENLHYKRRNRDATWYPGNLEQWVCRTCDQAVEHTAS